MENKVCKKCSALHPVSEFSYSKPNKDGLVNWCKACVKSYNKDYRSRNTDQIKEYEKSTKGKGRIKKWREVNADHLKKYYYERYWKDPEKARRESSEFQKRNRGKKNEYMKKYLPIYHAKYPGAKISKNLRNRACDFIFKNIKTETVSKLIGCSHADLKAYLESKFLPGMTWGNYGKNGWEVDHIIPCSSFDMTLIENQRKCFHYTNLQPLWADDNRKKSDTIMCPPTQYTGFTRVDKTSHIPSVPSKNCTPNNFGMVFAV